MGRPAAIERRATESDPADKLLVTPEEAARRLSMSRSSVYERLRSGDLFSVKDGRRRRIPVTALDRYVERLVAAQEVADEAAR
jgi:excisionase family DNA binding protein